MPNVLPTIPNDPPQGIQALLDKVYLWNPDVSNELIEKINALLAKLGDAIGAIRPYNEMVAPINQYEPCYYGSGVYVASRELTEVPAEFNEADWILIATKGVTAEEAAQTYLPLSGGTMTGRIDFNPAAGTAGSNKALISAQTADGLKALFGAKTDENGILRDVAVIPKLQGDIIACDDIRAAFIGNINDIVTRIHVKKITSKGITDAITIPPNAGTMARLEDLTGDKIYITFAGQEDTVQNAIDTLKTDQGDLGGQVSTIESKIPADASETNPLVTKNEILALPTFTYKVVTELPKTGEENIIYLVPKAGEGNDVHDEYIWVNGSYELIGTTAVDLSGYLPLTGGTMTGTLASNVPDYTKSIDLPGFSVQRSGGSVVMAIGSSLELNSGGVNDLSPYLSDTATLGNESIKWKNVYTTKLNNGADIAVPADGGTLARIEDINAIGGVGTAGQVLTKTENGMAWQDAAGGSSLPDQTGNAGKFLTTDGTTASWGDALVDNAQDEGSFAVGPSSSSRGAFATAVGRLARAWGQGAIQLGNGTNVDNNTFKVATAIDNFVLMDANGNVPLERLTYVTNQIGDISTALTAILGE